MRNSDPSWQDRLRPDELRPGGGPLTPEETERYRRHLVLPEIGSGGQLKLKQARVLIVGAGGLGAPAGLYLAAAGLGRITLVDDDRVELTNLQRQVLFGVDDVGKSKVDAAKDRLAALNPHVEFTLHRNRLTRANATDLIRGHDVVIDGSDNFATRYLVNDVCVLLGVPHVHGSVFRFDGQASVFADEGGPCYRCLYPAPPEAGSVPDCAEGGVLGVLPGIVGAIMAAEAIKWIVGAGTSLRGRLFRIDALTMKFSELAVARDPDCPVCGDHPTIRELADVAPCDASRKEEHPVSMPEMTVKELKRRLDAGDDVAVLDVREPHEFEICNLGGVLIPLGELPARMQELDPTREIVVHCHHGGRSARAVEFLEDAGFEKVWNLKGGIAAWANEIDPNLPKY
jgi:molybdopterin/thiamine biosynthesis adenylyltransferase/rhodanese-related sulfurtransferase